MTTVLVAVLLGSLFISIPIAVALALSTIVVFFIYYQEVNMITNLAQAMVTTADSFTLLAIPFFMLIGSLMEKSGIAESLINFAESLVGRITGGLGMTTIVASLLFAAISGSGVAEVAAIGAIMVPLMAKKGYDRDYAGALVAASATMGPVIPPGITLIIYGVTVGVSITALFTAAAIPGVILGMGLIVYNYFTSKKRGYKGLGGKTSIKAIMKDAYKAKWALFLPVIILGGIYTGVFTPTEAAVVGSVYSLVVGAVVYKAINFKVLKEAFVDSALLSAIVMFLLGGATVLGRLFALERIPERIAESVLSLSDSAILIMIMINVILLIAGMFLDPTSSIILLAPLFLPIVVELGYDPVFFGVIMIINLCIGLLTPPVGMNLFVAQSIADVSFERLVVQVFPMILILIIVLIILIAFPQIVMFLPNLLGH
ncbi:TRAP transporter large permease [Virgibacillus sp. W0181]|uniref:TRAP transporter large permease n=1 Tax=Virgibacillus sp. W0181 TaxID=3391581 RepID=UPI003F488172